MNELKVNLENILPLTFARDHFSSIVAEVQKDKLFILTKGGKPAVAIIDVKYLESLTGGQIQKQDISEEIKKAPEKVGLPPMIEHPAEPKPIERPKPFDSAQGKPTGFTPPPAPKPISPPASPNRGEPPPMYKPAGFAAPMPPPPAPAPISPPPPPPPPAIPKPAPTPIPAPKPVPPPGPKIETTPEPKMPAMPTTPPPPPAGTEPLKRADGSLVMPPIQGKKPAADQVSVEFAPDADMAGQDKTAPDDKNSPAQYDGTKPASPAGGENPPSVGQSVEPEDMALD